MMYEKKGIILCYLMFLLGFVNAAFTRRNLTSYLLDSERYDASIVPDFDEEFPTNVSVQITIHDMYSVSEANMEYSADLYLRMFWIDERLNFSSMANFPRLELDSKFFGSIWQPDLFFENEKKASVHSVTSTNKLIHIFRNGTVIYSVRLAITMTCTMQLHYYPFDEQKCPVFIQSFGYTKDNINLDWKFPKPFVTEHLEMPQFYLDTDNIELTDYELPYSATGTFSTLRADLILKRKYQFYVLQVFIPSILLVFLSWVSFWVDASAVPARVSLGVTCVLTLTTQSSGTRQMLPPVSYVKAIDVWMFMCLLFVFAALLEFAYVNVLMRRKKKEEAPLYENEDLRHKNDEPEPEAPCKGIFSCLPCKMFKYVPKTAVDRARRVDNISKFAFPGVFLVFLLIFFIICN